MCRFYALGNCRYGIRCTYSHALPGGEVSTADPEELASLVDCPFFQRGDCKFGDVCRFSHAATQSAASTTTPDSNNLTAHECGICFEDVVAGGKRFGLMGELGFLFFFLSAKC